MLNKGKELNMSNSFTRERIVRMKPLVVMAALALAGLAMPGKSDAAVFADSTSLDAAYEQGLALSVSNGGAAVIIETYTADGNLILSATGTAVPKNDGGTAVFSASHVFANSAVVDPNYIVKVVTGTNAYTDRGLVISPSEIIFAPGADGTSNKLDLAAVIIPQEIPGLGQIVIGTTPSLGQQLTAVGAGIALTQSQGRDGTFDPWDGGYSRYDGWYSDSANYGNDEFLDASIFQVGQFLFGGVSAIGDSGGPIFNTSSFQYDEFGHLTYAELVGIVVGYSGDRLGVRSSTVYTDLTDRDGDAYQFIMDILSRPSTTIPEPSTLGIGVLGAVGLLLRRRRS